MSKFNVGDKVLVADQRPPAHGVVVKVSTWTVVIGKPASAATCYEIESTSWQPHARWIDEDHLAPEEEGQ